MARPRIAVTPGDPRGIGPEVARAAISSLAGEDLHASLVVVGPDGILEPEALVAPDPTRLAHTGTDERAGAAAAGAIDRAVAMCLAGELQGVVTGPLHKPSLRAAGRHVPGQTEMLAELAGVDRVGMLMAAERTRLGAPLRVLLATTHLALRDVPAAVHEDLLVDQTELLARALRGDWGLEQPRIALCALNPHASDGGLFGTEEASVYGPALERLRTMEVRVDGPIPADTVFSRTLAGEFDAVVPGGGFTSGCRSRSQQRAGDNCNHWPAARFHGTVILFSGDSRTRSQLSRNSHVTAPARYGPRVSL